MSANQQTLFEGRDLVEIPRARRTDPATSASAAVSAKELASRHAAIIQASLAKRSPSSAEDIAHNLGGALTTLAIMKRISELLRAGVVVVVDELGRTSSGRRCRRYALANKEHRQ